MLLQVILSDAFVKETQFFNFAAEIESQIFGIQLHTVRDFGRDHIQVKIALQNRDLVVERELKGSLDAQVRAMLVIC